MTNKEKFIEIMNKTFNADFTKVNFRQDAFCPPVNAYKTGVCANLMCVNCRYWWDEKYEEV